MVCNQNRRPTHVMPPVVVQVVIGLERCSTHVDLHFCSTDGLKAPSACRTVGWATCELRSNSLAFSLTYNALPPLMGLMAEASPGFVFGIKIMPTRAGVTVPELALWSCTKRDGMRPVKSGAYLTGGIEDGLWCAATPTYGPACWAYWMVSRWATASSWPD